MSVENSKGSTLEKNYRPVLIREETKEKLKVFRRGLPNREIYQERRLATAALELVLQDSDLHAKLLTHAESVMKREANEL